ncbi:MFS transporter [Eubacteriales bacterium OttesenSCG-928-K08]|nr:MFS transporter [Eubacteriales bacterium OttesenSCG-928-K08]
MGKLFTKGKLGFKEYAAYVCGFIMLNISQLADQYGLFFMTDVAKFSSAAAGTILMVTSTIAAFIDPIIGNYVDQTESRWGKYRPYVMFAPIVVALMLVLRFSAPGFSQGGLTVFYSIAIGIFVIAMAFCSVPLSAFRTVLSDDYNDRNTLLSLSSLSSAAVGNILGIVCLSTVALFGGGERGWFWFAACCAVLMVICAQVCQMGVRHIDAPGKIATPPKKPLVTALFRMFKNKPVMCVGFAMFLSTFVTMIANNVAIHYYTHVLHDPSVLARTSAYGLPVQIISLLSLPFILRKISKRTLLFIGFGVSMIKPIVIMLFGATLSPDTVVLLIILSRVGGSFFTPAITSLIPECVDWTNLKEGAGAAALIGATISFLQKMGRSVASGVAGGLLAFAGYTVGAEITQSAVTAILNMNGIYQAIGLCLALVPILLFPINKQKGEELRAALRERDAGK